MLSHIELIPYIICYMIRYLPQELIDIMERVGVPAEKRPAIIPKIEKPAALKNIDEILALSGGLMVARGDLGVELGLHRVPFAQKFLIRKGNAASKFVITATQMMESMIENAVPTRAEVSVHIAPTSCGGGG